MKRRRIARSRAKGVPPAGAMRMARKCCVPNCKIDVQEARTKGLPLHKFPKDAVLRGRWLTSGGFETRFKPTPGQVVCHRHFKRADYEAANKTNKLALKKGSVPSVFANYDNHPDPVIMSVKTSTSYAQEDLDLINAEILNMRHSPLISEDRTPKSDSCGETCYSRPESSADSVNLLETSDLMDQQRCKLSAGRNSSIMKEGTLNGTEIKANNMAIQSGIVESEKKVQHVSKDVNPKTEVNGFKKANEKEFDKGNNVKSKTLNRDSLKFFPGAKLEAKDFNEKWYSAKVVETDWVEREVLIHFHKWSARFDEWIPMDSSRLRVLQTETNEQSWVQPSSETNMKEFSVGERILATWADGRKYPAKVNAVLGNDRYDVLFDDGYAKIVRSSKMTKIATPPETQAVKEDGYIGSKQERRDKKRKHTVMELFHTHSRKRSKNESDKTVKKEESVVRNNVESFPEPKIDLDGTLFGPCYDPGTDLLKGFNANVPKTKSLPKKAKKETHKSDTEQEEYVGPAWVDGEPQGIESYIVDGNDGPRRSIIVPDKRLPPGWQKHFTQRKAGTSAGKWDVLFIHKSSGKKFRSRNDIRTFMESQGQFDFDPEKFDFCIHRKKKNHGQKLKQDVPTPEIPKKIKTLLPKVKTPTSNETTLLMSINTTPVNTPVASAGTTGTSVNNGAAVFIGGLRVEMEDSAYKCPKQGCNKTFRKENLLQMHIKHYHPEYSKFLGSTPNVADLAYARTIGESIDDIIPKKSTPLLEKIHKFGKKKAQERSPVPTSQLRLNFVQPSSPSVSLPTFEEREDEVDQLEKVNELHKEDIKIETMSPISSHSIEIDEEVEKRKENSCAMSPGTLFDMKIREEKPEKVGIKTLLPVRPPVTPEIQRVDRSKSLDDSMHIERGKGQRKRQLSEYSSDVPSKGKRRHGMQDIVDDYGDLDDSAVDAEGPTALIYRYSRRKSDSKSDENSQNSQLNDSRLEKGDPFKGDSAKRDNSNDAEESEGVMMMINGEMVKVEQLRREEIINCTCGYMEEDGLMIQCDLCLCWQHGHCNAIEKEKDVPEKYVCYICRHPYRERPSKKYYHDQDWIKEGKLPSLSTRTKNQNAINKRTAILKRSYDLVAALLQMQQILHSLRVKINVAQKKDHPKLYLWAKNWEKLDVPKPDMEPVPIIEVMKIPIDSTDTSSETSRRTDIKIETKTSVKDDHDDKSIASDSELMKILEEDSSTSDESKVMCKKEDTINSNGGHILLDALTRNGSPDEKQKLKLENAIENINTNGSEDNRSISGLFGDNIHGETNVPEIGQELSTPLQPFIPEPEAPIDSAECRMRLLEHIEHFQSHIDSRLVSIEAQVCALEAMDPDEIIPSPDVQPRTKQTVQMLLRDLNTVRKLAALC
ncbi:PHD finger protein 20 isoform X3 [Vespa velutina]|uniref:PHD finger protein 20 isoform X3 n=1 Tax=Vespa velutina TaxID=202808 RepID=UPI001FB51F35|nr:PHD finger protein 20 isoform X3 [Vespa velutina]